MPKCARGKCLFLSIALLIFGQLFVPADSFAQAAGTGTIQGTITDESGAVIPQATVTVRHIGKNIIARTLTTTAEGRYVAAFLEPGDYQLTVEKPGFAKLVRSGIVLRVGDTLALDLTLKVSPTAEIITVTEDTPLIETEKTETSSLVEELSVRNLPLSGRRWEELVLLTPAVSEDGGFGLVSYRGVSGLYNNNMVDGADNNQAFFSETRGRTRLQYTYSLAAIKEFQVITSNYSAEFGRSAGGIVNAVTKSGTNDWHGEAFYFIRHHAWMAQDPISKSRGEPEPHERRQQFGASVGGPLVKDKFFLFANYDQQLHNFPVTVAFFSPDYMSPTSTSTTLRCRDSVVPACTAARAFLQQMVGVKPREGNQNVFLIKSDWQVNASNRISGVFNLLNWRGPNNIITPIVTSITVEGQGFDGVKTEFLTAAWLSTLRPTVVNEFRFQFGRDFEFQRPNASPPSTTQTSGISFGMPNFLPRLAFPNEKRWQFMDNLSWVRGRHSFKAGVDINYVQEKIINLFQGGGVYSYPNAERFAADFARNYTGVTGCGTARDGFLRCYSSYNQATDPITGMGAGNFSTTDWNFYFQDNIKLTSRLFLAVGVRYEVQQLPDALQPNPLAPITGIINTDTNNFAPRAALAFQVDPKTVLRAGYGIYYGRTQNSNIFVSLFQNGVFQQGFSFSSSNCAGPNYPNLVFAPPSTAPALAPVAPGGPTPIVQAPPVGCTISSSAVVTALEPNFESPVIHQGELAIEREVFGDWSLSASYLTSRGQHLPRFQDSNLSAATSTASYAVRDASNTTDVDFIQLPFYPSTTPRPNTAVGVILTGFSDINSWYNAFVARARKRFSRGFQLDAHFTFSRTLDTGHAPSDIGTFAGTTVPVDPFNYQLERGLSDLNIPKRFVLNGYWELPLRESENLLARIFLINWKASTILRIQDGRAVTANVSGIPSGALNGALTGGSTDRFGGRPSFTRAPHIARNIFEQPTLATVSVRLARDFNLGEDRRIEFAWDAFNLFNRTNITSVDSLAFRLFGAGTASCPSAGRPADFRGCLIPESGFLSDRGAGIRTFRAREMQFALRFFF